MKTFICSIDFQPESYTIRAKNKTEAKKKIYAKLQKKTALSVTDKKKTDITEY